MLRGILSPTRMTMITKRFLWLPLSIALLFSSAATGQTWFRSYPTAANYYQSKTRLLDVATDGAVRFVGNERFYRLAADGRLLLFSQNDSLSSNFNFGTVAGLNPKEMVSAHQISGNARVLLRFYNEFGRLVRSRNFDIYRAWKQPRLFRVNDGYIVTDDGFAFKTNDSGAVLWTITNGFSSILSQTIVTRSGNLLNLQNMAVTASVFPSAVRYVEISGATGAVLKTGFVYNNVQTYSTSQMLPVSLTDSTFAYDGLA